MERKLTMKLQIKIRIKDITFSASRLSCDAIGKARQVSVGEWDKIESAGMARLTVAVRQLFHDVTHEGLRIPK
jgi:hypothetical protein